MARRWFLLWLLLVPGLLLGPGWKLRICPQAVVGSDDCCMAEREPRCCSDEKDPADPVAESGGPCDACCIDIATGDQQPVPAAESPSRELKRSQVALLAASVPEVVAGAWPRAWAAPPDGPPRAPSRCTPLPLRI